MKRTGGVAATSSDNWRPLTAQIESLLWPALISSPVPGRVESAREPRRAADVDDAMVFASPAIQVSCEVADD